MVITLILLIVLTAQSKPLSPKKVIYAVDCGGLIDTKSSLGVKFQKDSNFSTNVETLGVDYETQPDMVRAVVRFTQDKHIYMSERHAEFSFKYFIPLTKNWDIPNTKMDYVLILKFAEFYFKESKKRIFDVRIGNQNVVQSLDVYDVAGFSTAHDEYIELKYDGGNIYFKGKLCLDAIKNNAIEVEFVKTEYNNPMVQAILLYPGQLSDTDFEDSEENHADWDRRHSLETQTQEQRKETAKQSTDDRKQLIDKKLSIIKVRSGFEHELGFEEIVHDKNKRKTIHPLSWEFVYFMVGNPLGIVFFIAFLAMAFILGSFAFFDPYGQKALIAQIEARSKRASENKSPSLHTQDSSVSSVSDQNEQTDPQHQQIDLRQQQPPQRDTKQDKVGKVQVADLKKRE